LLHNGSRIKYIVFGDKVDNDSVEGIKQISKMFHHKWIAPGLLLLHDPCSVHDLCPIHSNVTIRIFLQLLRINLNIWGILGKMCAGSTHTLFLNILLKPILVLQTVCRHAKLYKKIEKWKVG
jgi:hypothetical protein